MYELSEERARRIGRMSTPTLTVRQVLEFVRIEWTEGQEHQAWLDNGSEQAIADWISDCLHGVTEKDVEAAVGPA